MDQTNGIQGVRGVRAINWSRGEDGLTDNQRLVLGIYSELEERDGAPPRVSAIVAALPAGTTNNPYTFVTNSLKGLARRGLVSFEKLPHKRTEASSSSAISGVIESLTAKRDALMAEVRKIDKAITNLRSVL